MLKLSLISILFLILGLFLGGGWAINSIQYAEKKGGFARSNGNWSYNPVMDLAGDDLQRAVIGKIGLFALRESEVLYYLATTDSDGRPLSSKYSYQLDGGNYAARYWSYTLYGEDHFLIPNKDKVYSVNLDNIYYHDGTHSGYTIILSKNPAEPNWLPSGNGENMSVLLRMYNPDQSVYNKMDSIELPVIKRIGI